MRVILKGKPKKATSASIQYDTPSGSYYVKKAQLKAAGYNKAPDPLFFVITDEQPEDYTEAMGQVEFEL